ncbi:hypothetical protein EON68_04610, partial [archaeon]
KVERATNSLVVGVVVNEAEAFDAPPPVDAHCDVEAALADLRRMRLADSEAARAAALASTASSGASAARGLVLRAIKHPNFHNMTQEEGFAALATRPTFDFLFRPSGSGGLNQITLMWKVGEPNVIVQKAVVESDKEGLAPNALGRRLTIDGATYSDLDELIVRHLQPMIAHHRALRACDKYLALPLDMVSLELKKQKAENPRRVAYLISPSTRDYFDAYFISYILNTSVSSTPVKVVPAGYQWQGKVSPHWRKLIEDFKARCQTLAASRNAPPAPGAAVPGVKRPSRWRGTWRGRGASRRAWRWRAHPPPPLPLPCHPNATGA